MKRSAFLALFLATALPIAAQDWTGVWVGGTNVLGDPIFVQAKLKRDGDALRGTLEVPAQDALLPMRNIATDGTKIKFDLDTPFGLFRVDGALDGGIIRAVVHTPAGRDAEMHFVRTAPLSDASAFAGTFVSASGETLIATPRTNGQLRLVGANSLSSLRLVPTGDNRFLDAASVVKDPAGARELEFPFGRRLDVIDQEPVTFRNGSITLSGTLFSPKSKAPHSAAVVVHGSGAVTRDMLLQRGQLLLRMGVALLLYDKRGTGQSEGDWRAASFEDLAGDAIAAVRYLRARPDIDQTKLGIVGHSQAGWIIPIVTTREPELAFALIASGGAVTPEEQEVFRAEAQTHDPKAKELTSAMWSYARTGKDFAVYERLWNASVNEKWFGSVAGAKTAADPLWNQVRAFAAYDPLPYLRSSRVPTLVILGANDENLPAKRAASLWRDVPRVDVVMIANAGHNLMQKTKDNTYVFAPEYIVAMRTWLEKKGIDVTPRF